MNLARRDPLRDRYRLNGGHAQRFPGLPTDPRLRAPLFAGGLRGRDPYDSLRGGGALGRFNDPLAHYNRRRIDPDPIYNNLGTFPRARQPDVDHLIALRRQPYGHSHYDNYHGHSSPCDDCQRSGRRCDMDRDYRCDRDYNCCGKTKSNKSESGCRKTYEFKTKDITVRGKSYCVRKSFLADSSKFEADLIKFMDKKKEDQISDGVVQMLIDYINEEGANSGSLLDFVLMNVLASNLGVKSAVEYSLNELKKADMDRRTGGDEITNVAVAVLMSNKVDSGLAAWLKKFLSYDHHLDLMTRSYQYQGLLRTRPELEVKVEALLGYRENVEDDALPIL